jgi:hypothetical protein
MNYSIKKTQYDSIFSPERTKCLEMEVMLNKLRRLLEVHRHDVSSLCPLFAENMDREFA